MKAKYSFILGSRMGKKSATNAGRELERLTKVNGGLTADNVVDTARSTASPLHEFFEWNNTVAAQQYRLEQARHLMRSVVVIYDGPTGDLGPVRAFIAFQSQPGILCEEHGRYVAMHRILTEPELRDQLVNEAMAEHIRWEKRYQHLKELAMIIAAGQRVRNKWKKRK